MVKKNNNNNIKKIKKSSDDFDLIISEFKLKDDIDLINTKPVDVISSNTNNRELLANKLKLKIMTKQQTRSVLNSTQMTQMEETKKELTDMLKHPKINKEILILYAKAIEKNPTQSIPTPIEIVNNINKYKAIYYEYIRNLLKSMMDKKISLVHMDRLLDIPYGHYMSTCIGCPLNPFSKK
jgi:hypothetical protein